MFFINVHAAIAITKFIFAPHILTIIVTASAKALLAQTLKSHNSVYVYVAAHCNVTEVS